MIVSNVNFSVPPLPSSYHHNYYHLNHRAALKPPRRSSLAAARSLAALRRHKGTADHCSTVLKPPFPEGWITWAAACKAGVFRAFSSVPLVTRSIWGRVHHRARGDATYLFIYPVFCDPRCSVRDAGSLPESLGYQRLRYRALRCMYSVCRWTSPLSAWGLRRGCLGCVKWIGFVRNDKFVGVIWILRSADLEGLYCKIPRWDTRIGIVFSPWLFPSMKIKWVNYSNREGGRGLF